MSKKVFTFNIKKACTGNLENDVGMRCVVGQFYAQVAKKSVLNTKDDRVYNYFTKKTGINDNQAVSINDGKYSWGEKAKKLKELFKKSKTFTLKVVGI